jgi:crotonobetainyl-CoA:carnitine CoA-transferase CaiB-like acyl-CoA transferase
MSRARAHGIERVEIAGDGVASDYARHLLADLGVPVAASAGPADPHPALAWAASGAMALSGEPDALPRVADGPLASCAAGVGRALSALGVSAPPDAAALLAERAALFGLTRRGRVSPGQSCRLLRAADGWAALNLPRTDDVRALPAWLEASPRDEHESWTFAAREMRNKPLALLAERARWLGLPFAPVVKTPHPAAPWLRAAACGPRGEVPRRAPRVLDFSSLWAGPLCAQLLVDAGADVIKIESAHRPDGARAGARAFYDLLNAGKRSVALDFASERDAALLHALVASADVVIEGTRPRALAQLGVDAEAFLAAHPGRVWVGITGYGRTDPPPGRVAFGDDAAVAAGAALAVADREGPLFCGDAIADPLTGLHAALAAWAAWRSGGGALLDLSLVGATAHALAFAPVADFSVQGDADRARVVAAGQTAEVAPPRARAAPRRARSTGADTEALRRELGPAAC